MTSSPIVRVEEIDGNFGIENRLSVLDKAGPLQNLSQDDKTRNVEIFLDFFFLFEYPEITVDHQVKENYPSICHSMDQ